MSTPLSNKQVMRYNRQIVLPQIDIDGQETLASSRILIVGAGGLGNAAAMSLCASGVGNITLVDNDTVEHTNLPRQTLFDESQIDQPKVVAAKARLLQLNRDCKITAIETNLSECTQTLPPAAEYQHSQYPNSDELFRAHDIVLDCTDNAQSRDLINRLCYQHGVPLVSGAAIRFEGQIFVAKPGVSQCYACLRTLFNAPELSCTEAGIFSPIVNIVGTYQALLAMQVLIGVGSVPLNTLLTFDGLQHEWQQWALPKMNQCDVCGSHPNSSDPAITNQLTNNE